MNWNTAMLYVSLVLAGIGVVRFPDKSEEPSTIASIARWFCLVIFMGIALCVARELLR